MSNYQKIKEQQAPLNDCFFAFSKTQYQEGVIKHNLQDKPLYNTGFGLIGTREGIKAFNQFYTDQAARIANECNPQEVYDHEFNNHECGYVCDDKEAIDIVVEYFGAEKAKEVNRRFAYSAIVEPSKAEAHV